MEQEHVIVPKELLAEVLDTALGDSHQVETEFSCSPESDKMYRANQDKIENLQRVLSDANHSLQVTSIITAWENGIRLGLLEAANALWHGPIKTFGGAADGVSLDAAHKCRDAVLETIKNRSDEGGKSV